MLPVHVSSRGPVTSMKSSRGMPREAEGLALFFLQQGSKRDAVRLYQEETGAGRAEAKRAVEKLARRHGVLSSNMGIADLMLVALMVTSLVLGLVLR